MSEPEIIYDTNQPEQPECPLNQLNAWNYFPSMVYSIEKPEFIEDVAAASKASTPEDTTVDEIYPVIMSNNIHTDPRSAEFMEYVGKTAWNILHSQGYDMSNRDVFFSEIWHQEHQKHSLMEEHTHANGVQLVGFYFLETPENCSKLLIHDPRPAKVQINLPQSNMNDATVASDIINFTPTPGLLMFTNAWLHHSFGRHASDEPIKFIHFNIGTQWVDRGTESSAEII